jgi:hypothetical protein
MARARSTPKPEHVHVRMYQVGFGDCFLVTFVYGAALPDGRDRRHVLIDFGSSHRPASGPRALIGQAANLLAEHTGGVIDVVVATHRHRDHLSGFGAEDAQPLLAQLQPSLVVRPWTDDPGLAADATKPRGDERRFAAGLATGQEFAALLAQRAGKEDRRSLRGAVAAMALEQLPNQEAIQQLEQWADGGRGEYLAAGMATRMEQVVPGIRVRVLGPPTIADAPEMVRARANDPEYWLAYRRQLASAPEAVFRADARTDLGGDADGDLGLGEPGGAAIAAELGPVSWLIERINRQQLNSLLRIVRTVDDALNNTSLILLIDAGDRRMLFPGDAQIENWSWALRNAPNAVQLRNLLRGVDLYKVGHHGSRNATPKSLFRLWGEDPDPSRPITALMSTLRNVHGESEATRVPRSTLVAALGRRMTLLTTDGLPAAQPFVEVAAAASGSQPFAPVV